MNPDDYRLIKETLISVDGLPLQAQIAQAKIACENRPELIDSIIEMLTDNAKEVEVGTQDVFAIPPILEHVSENLLPPDTQINQYSIVEKIGSGGMGVVYSARQKFPAERLVALKLIRQLTNQAQLIKETNTLAQLNHPNIATLFEIDKSGDEQLFIAMELIEGEDIIRWCETHHDNDEQKIRLFQQLCSGITYAHEKGIIHCDIKPSNILVTKKNDSATVKIIDFGISQHEDQEIKRDQMSGTFSYLAPEILEDKQHLLADTRRDVYAMGVLLDKLLSEGRNTELQAIIDKATATDREQRYSTAEKLSRDLDRYFNKEPLSARENNWRYLSLLFLKRRFILVFVVMAFAGSLVGGYIVQAKQAQAALVAQLEAEEISTFLTDLFNVANPERSDVKIASAYDLLNKAKDKLLAIENPDLSDARFLHTIGTIYTRMDKLKDALVVIEKSLAIKKQWLTDNDPDVIVGTIELGLLYKNLNLYEQAEQQLLTAINGMQRSQGGDQAQLASAHNHLGNLYKRTHEFEKSISQHLAAMHIREALEDKKLLADSYNNLGAIYLVKHQFKEANFYMHKALVLYESQYGEFHPYVGIAKSNLSRIEESLTHDYEKVEQYLLEALVIFKKSYGTDHYNTTTLQVNVLSFYNRRMQFDKALEFYDENIATMMASGKPNKIIYFNNYMGWTYAKANQFEKSAQLYLDTLAMAVAENITHRDLHEKLYIGYAKSLIEQKNYSLAQTQLDKALLHSKARVPAFLPYQLKVQGNMAELAFKRGDVEASKNQYLEIITHTEDSRLYNLEYVRAYIGLSKIYALEEDHLKNQSMLDKARALTLALNRREHSFMGQVDYQQGLLHLSQKKILEATMSLQKAQTLQSKILPQIHPDLLATEQYLNAILISPTL